MSVAAQKLTPADLVQAASSLGASDLEQLVRLLLVLRAQRYAASLSEMETDLLLQVNRGLAPDARERFLTLVERRRAQQLDSVEHEELLRLTDQIEHLDGQRLHALLKLAQLRGQPLRALMDDLGIKAPPVMGLA